MESMQEKEINSSDVSEDEEKEVVENIKLFMIVKLH